MQFDPKNYAQTLVNTYNVSPVLCNFQKGFDESNANCRLVSPPPKKRCLLNKLLNKKSDPEARYQILKKARSNIFIPRIQKPCIVVTTHLIVYTLIRTSLANYINKNLIFIKLIKVIT